LLEGKKVNMRVMEKEDLPLFAAWNNDRSLVVSMNLLIIVALERSRGGTVTFAQKRSGSL